MKSLCFAVALGLAGLSAANPDAKQDRMKVILQSFANRVSQQNDIWFDDGEFPRVIQLLRISFALNPSDYDIATNLGWMQENVERWDQALLTYIRFRRANPNDPEAYYPEAYLYFKKKMYAKVPALLEPTLKMSTKPHANTYRTLALSYERSGLLSDAKRVWLQLIERDPKDDNAKGNLKRVEQKLAGG
jgi:tetratricopeptide (TPR) repeat protein